MMRLSYTIIEKWIAGDHNNALAMLQGLYETPNVYMIFGRTVHEVLDRDASKTFKTIGVEYSKKKVETEIKLEKQVNDWLTLVGVIDAVTDDTIIEYKTTISPDANISKYTNSYQGAFYKFLMDRKYVDFYLFNFGKAKAETTILKDFKVSKENYRSLKPVIEQQGRRLMKYDRYEVSHLRQHWSQAQMEWVIDNVIVETALEIKQYAEQYGIPLERKKQGSLL